MTAASKFMSRVRGKKAEVVAPAEVHSDESPPDVAAPEAELDGAQETRDDALFDAFGWALGATTAELNRSQPSQAHVLDLLGRSASTPERRKLLNTICEFHEAKVRPRTQEEYLRYQSRGHW